MFILLKKRDSAKPSLLIMIFYLIDYYFTVPKKVHCTFF